MQEIIIKHCRYRYGCDSDWLRMEKTEDPKIRRCGFCEREIHLVSTAPELETANENNCCVAVYHDAIVDFGLSDDEPTSVDFNLTAPQKI